MSMKTIVKKNRKTKISRGKNPKLTMVMILRKEMNHRTRVSLGYLVLDLSPRSAAGMSWPRSFMTAPVRPER